LHVDDAKLLLDVAELVVKLHDSDAKLLVVVREVAGLQPL
jgi:hypothetical protein